MSQTQCQNWNCSTSILHWRAKISEIRCLSLNACLHIFFSWFLWVLQLTFSSVLGHFFFSFLICKMIVLACTKQLNASLAGLFIWIQYRANICVLGEKINRCPKKACRQKASIMIDTALEMLWKSGLKYQFLFFSVAMTRCWIAIISVVHSLILLCLI